MADDTALEQVTRPRTPPDTSPQLDCTADKIYTLPSLPLTAAPTTNGSPDDLVDLPEDLTSLTDWNNLTDSPDMTELPNNSPIDKELERPQNSYNSDPRQHIHNVDDGMVPGDHPRQ
eukprot:g16821.t1